MQKELTQAKADLDIQRQQWEEDGSRLLTESCNLKASFKKTQEELEKQQMDWQQEKASLLGSGGGVGVCILQGARLNHDARLRRISSSCRHTHCSVLGVVGSPRRGGEDPQQQRVLQCERSGRLRSGEKNTLIDTHRHTSSLWKLVYGQICSDAVATQADMDEYLRRVQRRVGADTLEDPIHAVLGGPDPDVDTVAATLCLALHLSQIEQSGGVFVPVLCGQKHDGALPGETVRFLHRVKISESSLLWRDDVDLMKLHHRGKLSLTLLREGLLDGSEFGALESSVLRVVHHDGQRDAQDDGASSAVTTVAREILQEAAEHVGAALGETLREALWLQSEAVCIKHGCRSPQLEELMRSVELRSDIAAGHKTQDLEQQLTLELKEFSDGEMTIALASVTTDKEDWHDYVEVLKTFSHRHGYDGLVVLLSVHDTLHHPRQQMAVYSSNSDILNQICCELEECSSWSLSGELEAKESLQLYHIPINTTASSGTPPLLVEEIQGLLKDFVDRRSSVLACHPSSRTSSTEGVAGSVEFSQGSSGINDMDGSDTERAEEGSGDAVPVARVIAEGEEETGAAGGSAVGELVSPDSGMTTIRSSRSSKESSVFLSDDSPIGEVTAAAGPGGLFMRNPSPLGLLSLSPPVPPERRKNRSSRNKSDNCDLFSFDPMNNSDNPMAAGGELPNSGAKGDETERRAGSDSLSELDELSLLDFSAPNSFGRLESRNSSIDQHGQICGIDTVVPPTPVNSVVGSRPPSSCGVRFFPEDVVERINGLQQKDSVSSSLSETWDELSFDTHGALSSSDSNAWNRAKERESPENILEDTTERESKEEISLSENANQKGRSLEPQLSLITEQTESYDSWNPESVLKDQWNPVTLAYLQLTPPEEEASGKCRVGTSAVREQTSSLARKKAILNTLTPDTSKEEDEGVQGNKGDRKMELLDFWTYSAQKGLLKSDSGTTASYPESLDMWNMTIRDDSLSPLTTPDNLSENSGSFGGLNPNLGAGASVESPVGYSDGGMAMWNTTIREDSSSTITSPEGPDNGKDLSHTGSLDSPETHLSKKVDEDKAKDEGRGTSEEVKTPEDVGPRVNEHNVKIIIEVAEDGSQEEEMLDRDTGTTQELLSKHSEDGTSSYQGADVWDLPVPSMTTSTSEYDNVGAGTWSLSSSPETCASLEADMIQLEGQSSPFVAVPQFVQKDERQYQKCDPLGMTEGRAVISAKEETSSQVFLFEGTSKLDQTIKDGEGCDPNRYERLEKADWKEQPGDHSPFLLVDCSTVTQAASVKADETQIQPEQSHSPSLLDWGNLIAKKHEASESYKLPFSESQVGPYNEITGTSEGKPMESMSLSSSSGGEKDTLKFSPDNLHPGSSDELRSNSDGDSSSCLEMDYIIVSGTVKEAEREWDDRPRQTARHSKGTRKTMETFSMLSYAATVLKSQVQASHIENQENRDQSSQKQSIESELSAYTETDKPALSTHYQESLKNDSEQQEMIGQSHSKSNTEIYQSTGYSQTQVDQGNYDDKSSIVTRSVSPSLRYPSDHFLKTREEVYVHSQISMEDSDEGGQSPSAPPTCPTSLGDFQSWRGQIGRQDTPQTSSEPQSPPLTNSSVSHTSSFAGTPLSESGVTNERGLGLPFSGDLMEEENDEEEQEEETEGQQAGSSDLLSFTEELIGGSSFRNDSFQTFEANKMDYHNQQPLRTVDKRQIGDLEASQDSYLTDLRRHQGGTSQPSSEPTNENAAYQWTGSQNVTQGQTQHGYNYHHIDQRTEHQSALSACAVTKSDSQQNATDVYAEFTTDAASTHYGSTQAEGYYEPGVNAEYSSDDPGNKYTSENQYGDCPSSMYASEIQCSQYQADGQGQYESDHAHYQFDGQPVDQSDARPKREDHARYMPEGYVHFLLSRHPQQRDDAAGMMMKTASSEEAAEEMDNREDPSSSADLSGGSNQRRKLAAPPMDVSLDRSEGSLLSEDALDTEDEALDTGDDLDVNIDELDTSDEAEDFPQHENSEETNLGAAAAASSEAVAHRAAEENRENRLWRSVVIGEQEHRIDMKCIEPYKRVISHGGYYAQQNAIIVFAACFLPDSNCDNYNYVMENLFLYVISTLELMVAEDYMIVYLNGATPRRRMPGFTWMKKCYQMIDRRLKKNLKMFIIVHPSWFIRTLLGITRPFISSKFSSKIKYVNSLQELGEIIPMEYVHIPPSIVKLDTELQDTAAKADRRGNSAV
ncbi:protein prune homolog 2-like [Cheilinus undulatus]|uniref:protein prune homolog 2-like n=1 Tax=Cheilinus undulatus TaxID=241271 RepID=UPI001BD67F0E|nr:protein prune homolog 2-like [Cheilinus undulatus]